MKWINTVYSLLICIFSIKVEKANSYLIICHKFLLLTKKYIVKIIFDLFLF
jgi:hypothetical protein